MPTTELPALDDDERRKTARMLRWMANEMRDDLNPTDCNRANSLDQVADMLDPTPPLKVGDRCIDRGGDVCLIIAIVGSKAWLNDSRVDYVEDLDSLRRAS